MLKQEALKIKKKQILRVKQKTYYNWLVQK